MGTGGLPTIRVRVVLKGGLATYAPGETEDHLVELPAGSRIVDALRLLGVPAHEVMGAVSGGVLKRPDDLLSDGEDLEVLPVIAGG